MVKERIFFRDFIILMIIGLCFSSSYMFILMTVSAYSSYEFGMDAAAGGLAACIFVLGALISRIMLAGKIKIIGKKILLYSTLFSFFTSALYLIVPNFESLIAVRFIHGLSFGIAMLTINSMVAEIVPASRRSEGLGYFMLSYTLSSAIAPFVGISLSHNHEYQLIFIINLGLMAISIIAYALLSADLLKPKEFRTFDRPLPHLSDLIEKSALNMSVVVLFFYLAYCSFITFISQYGDFLNLGWAASITFVAFAASTLVARLFFGKIADCKGENYVLIPCLVVFILGFIILGFADSSWMIILPGLFFGFSVSMISSIGQSIVIRRSVSERYPISLSTFQTFIDIANGIGPFLLGFVIVMFGYSNMYFTAAGLAFVSFLLYMFLHGLRTKHMCAESNS